MRKMYLNDGKIVYIREAEKEDALGVIKYLDNISYQSDFLTFGPGELSISLKEEEAAITDSMNSGNKIMLLAIVDDHIIGCLNFSGHKNSRVCHTGEFGVSILRDYWNEGIGSAMVEELINWAQNSKVIRKINLRVRSDNTVAIHLYHKLGFREEGVTTREFLIGGKFYDVIRMGLCIDQGCHFSATLTS